MLGSNVHLVIGIAIIAIICAAAVYYVVGTGGQQSGNSPTIPVVNKSSQTTTSIASTTSIATTLPQSTTITLVTTIQTIMSTTTIPTTSYNTTTVQQENTTTTIAYTDNSTQNSTDEPGATAPPQMPAGTIFYKNVTYCTINDTAYHLDVYIPNSTTSSSPRALVVYVHGGAWEANDKEHADGTTYFPSLVSNGFVLASINYGLAPENQWPTMIIDSKCAIRYLKSNAGMYDINPNEIGVYGSSAGGQIVSMLGVGALNQSWDSFGQWQSVSSAVQAVGVMYGPESLNYSYMTNVTYHSNVYCPVFGCSNQTLYLASPIIYVKSGDPPFLIQQGLDDVIVPYNQATMFYNALLGNSITANITLVQNAGHGFVQVGANSINPSKDALIREMVGFFNTYLDNSWGSQKNLATFTS